MIVVIALSKFPKVELSNEEKSRRSCKPISCCSKRVVILFFIAMICYVGTEQGMNNWISQFLLTYHGYDPQTTGAGAVANFWGLMMVGGIIGLLLLKIMDSRKVLIIFTLLALVCLTAAFLVQQKFH